MSVVEGGERISSGMIVIREINNPKFYSGRNKEWTEVRKCLLSFGAESFVFQVATQEIKD